MKRNRIIILLIVSVVLGFIGCASVRVNVNYDESVVFSDYRTFIFVRPRQHQMARQDAVRDPLITKEMMDEIGPIMESKGFVEAGSQEEADLLVVFYAAVHNQREFVPPTYRVGRWGRVWRARQGNYKEGTLVIDMVDRMKKELVWQGVGSGVLDRVQPARNLVEAVSKILEKFPPEK
jgi:hypothetical protein